MNSAIRRIRFFRVLLVSMISVIVSAVGYAQVWTRAASFGGVGSDAGVAVKVSPNGDRYLTGYFSDTDIFLAKFGRWVIQVGGASHEEPTDIALDDAGNVYLTGWFTDSATFHSTNGSVVTASGNSETIFLAKYSSSGVLAWVETGV